jgi:peptidyl-tRNA hydrolase, PTH1 family
VRIILGIGNFGNRYKKNRHNAGFMQLDYVAEKYSLSFIPSKSDYYFAEGKINISDFTLIKSTTYVNNSGVAAVQVLQNYKLDSKDLLVVFDDVNLNLSELRIRISGGDGGHNGIASIIYHLSTDQFPRIRIGVGNNFYKGEMADYVLTDFNSEEMDNLKNIFISGSELIEGFIVGGIKKMLDINSKSID